MNVPAASIAPPRALPARDSLFWLTVAPLGALPWSDEDHEAEGAHVQERFDLPETAEAELQQ